MKSNLAVPVYVTRWFDRWAHKEAISDRALHASVDELARGLIDANLGGNLYKKRVAAAGRGKRGSFRILVAFEPGARSFLIYGFGKGERDNIRDDEKRALKRLARELLGYDERTLAKAVEAEELREVKVER